MNSDCQKELATLFPSGVAGLIFDCDGVMIDSENANRAFYNIILQALGLPAMTEEQEKFAFMSTARNALLHMIPEKYHDKLEQIIREHVDYTRDILPRIRLMPGFREFIEESNAMGLKLAVDTNRTDFGTQVILQKFDLASFFHPVISCTGNEPKPSPAGPEKIRAAWQIGPEKILYFGDSYTDMAAAHGANIPFAAFRNKDLQGELHLEDFCSFGKIFFPFIKSTL